MLVVHRMVEGHCRGHSIQRGTREGCGGDIRVSKMSEVSCMRLRAHDDVVVMSTRVKEY